MLVPPSLLLVSSALLHISGGRVSAALNMHIAVRFARCSGISATWLVRPPSAFLHCLSTPEAEDFIPQRPFADSVSVKLIAFLAPRLPSRYCIVGDGFYVLCIPFCSLRGGRNFVYVGTAPMIARPFFLPLFRLEFINSYSHY